MSDTPSELAAAKREIDRLRAESFGLRRSLAEREREVSRSALSSTSWRITAPLRTLVNRAARSALAAPARRRRAPAAKRSRSTATSINAGLRSYSSVDAAMRARLVSAVESLAARAR
jgi:hypothetical protein